MMSKILAAALAATLAGAWVVHAGARQAVPLPPFVLTALDGTAVEAAALASDTTWLLVHVQARCAPCEALLAHIDSQERPAASRIVVVGSGMEAAAVAELMAKYPNMAASRWTADPPRQARDALRIQAAPTVFGLRGSNIEWRLAGGLRDRRDLESILFTWLREP